ncbi:MAG: ribosome silencing factor [Alphaproteobacteria bacterium]|nr:MAG: ribosome silencing factor [Alphaproteobacteria bacterium]
MVHAERNFHFPVLYSIQGKVMVIAAPTAATRMRRTGEASKTAQKVNDSMADDLKRVTAILEDYKAQNIVVIPLAGQASFADHLVIASGTSTRHVSSMGQALREKIGASAFLGLEGMQDGEWVCADMGGIVVHLFVPEKRSVYNLEKLWSHVFTEPPADTTT